MAERHRSTAQERHTRAEVAEQAAQRERAEAELQEARAKLHDQGLADEELERARSSGSGEERPDTTKR